MESPLRDTTTPVGAEKTWMGLKSEGAENRAFGSLMSLPGLFGPKMHFMKVRSALGMEIHSEVPISKDLYDVIFCGPPGCGKTTVVHLYANFLVEELRNDDRIGDIMIHRLCAGKLCSDRFFRLPDLARGASCANVSDAVGW